MELEDRIVEVTLDDVNIGYLVNFIYEDNIY